MKLWAFKRQMAGGGVIIVAFVVVAGVLAYKLKPIATCSDGRQNGAEEGVDCGAVCGTNCLEQNPKNPIELWARFFPIHDNVYDVAALVENVNIRTLADKVHYTFKLYDSAHVLLARREGATYLYPQSKMVIYEPNILIDKNRPAQVEFSIDDFSWQPFEEKDPLKIEVSERHFESDPYPLVRATLTNKAVFAEDALEVVALLERDNGTVYAVARTTIENIPSGGREEAVFTWPNTVLSPPATISLLYRRPR